MFKQYKDTDYDINEHGECFSHKSNKLLKPSNEKYPSYKLALPTGSKKIKIHRMVAETFLPLVEGKTIVNHIDGNTRNYDITNLEWVDYQENNLHAAKMSLRPKGNQNAIFYTSNLENEEWKPIIDFPNYAVSNCGRVMNINTKRLLRPALSNVGGYYEVSLWKQNKGYTKRIHYLVYTTFTEDTLLSGFVINHIDGNKQNNNLTNLEKVTYQYNNLHAEYIINTHHCAKAIQQLNANGEELARFNSIASAQRMTGIYNISRAIKTNRTAGGYYWKFL